MKAVRFFVEGIKVNCDALVPAAARIAHECGAGKSFAVFTINLDHVVKLRRDGAFRTAYKAARYVLADGFPIVWAGRLAGAHLDRVAGSDLIEPLCAEAATSGHPVFLFGGRFASLSGAARRLKAKYPELEIAGACAPEAGFDPSPERVADYARQISESGAKICFVALGAPKQEIFSSIAIEQTQGVAFVCIGAGLDFLSGAQVRAPRWAREMGAEWLWRLLSQPRRLARRYFDCILVLPSILIAGLAGQPSVINE